MPTVSDFAEGVASELGVPYRWGGSDPSGFDCSGLIYYWAQQMGVSIPRTSEAQFAQLPEAINPTVGDLVFFNEGGDIGHVGMCANEGCTLMIDAPNSQSVVRQEAVWPNVAGYRKIPGLNQDDWLNGVALGSQGRSKPVPGNLSSMGFPIDPGGAAAIGGAVAGGVIDNLNPLNLPGVNSIAKGIASYFLNAIHWKELVLRTFEVVFGGLLLGTGLTMLVIVIGKTDAGKGASAVKQRVPSIPVSGSGKKGSPTKPRKVFNGPEGQIRNEGLSSSRLKELDAKPQARSDQKEYDRYRSRVKSGDEPLQTAKRKSYTNELRKRTHDRDDF